MAKWEMGQNLEPMKRYHEIYCFTCIKSVPSKRFLIKHMGHEVHYRDKDGNLDD